MYLLCLGIVESQAFPLNMAGREECLPWRPLLGRKRECHGAQHSLEVDICIPSSEVASWLPVCAGWTKIRVWMTPLILSLRLSLCAGAVPFLPHMHPAYSSRVWSRVIHSLSPEWRGAGTPGWFADTPAPWRYLCLGQCTRPFWASSLLAS